MTVELKNFIGRSQMAAMNEACTGEEGPYFRQMMAELITRIEAMPQTYQTDGQGNEAMATLHYFHGGSDWYITERDMEQEQHQAFGFACLNGDSQNAELGYISIEELIAHGVELDLYYTPEKLGAIRQRLGAA